MSESDLVRDEDLAHLFSLRNWNQKTSRGLHCDSTATNFIASSWPRRRVFLSSGCVPRGTGKAEVGRTVECIQSGIRSESSSGAPSPSRSKVRRIKVTDGPAMVWERHMCSCVHGRDVVGALGFDDSDGESHRWLLNQTRFILNPEGRQ